MWRARITVGGGAEENPRSSRVRSSSRISTACVRLVSVKFILDIIASALDPPKFSPTVTDIKGAVALFPGKLVTYRSFKSAGPRNMRSTSEAEFLKAVEELTAFGKVVEVRVPRATRKTAVFLRKAPGEIQEALWTTSIGQEAFARQFSKATHSKVSKNIAAKIAEM
ncbi:hypothetical protein HOLleu_04590 [Holothuria leucospilota]|uniref:Uncharacterized protein n=1 Tax=Holothuria leucospilota TaxID=206669 RepID=A0A9Q1HMD7_HOLLE|nr:hypothetical protein HOLleu_04590 [Holothuria leucospilota]